MYWFVIVRFSLNLRASERILAKLSVAKFWNSSTYRKKSSLSSSGISTLCIAAACNRVIIIPPSNDAFSSPIFPCARFINSIFLLSMISLRSIVDFTCPTMFRMTDDEMNLPTLFWIGATASVINLEFWDICSYSSCQNFNKIGSLSCFNMNFL